MHKQCLINLGQALEDGGVGGNVLAHLDEGTDDIHAHGHGARAVEDVGCHEGVVFGKSKGQGAAATATAL